MYQTPSRPSFQTPHLVRSLRLLPIRISIKHRSRMTLTNLSRRVGPHYPATEAVRDIYLRSIKPYRGRLTLVDEDRSPIRGVKLISSPGHSPGHSSVRFQGKGEALLVSGDSWITKVSHSHLFSFSSCSSLPIKTLTCDVVSTLHLCAYLQIGETMDSRTSWKILNGSFSSS